MRSCVASKQDTCDARKPHVTTKNHSTCISGLLWLHGINCRQGSSCSVCFLSRSGVSPISNGQHASLRFSRVIAGMLLRKRKNRYTPSVLTRVYANPMVQDNALQIVRCVIHASIHLVQSLWGDLHDLLCSSEPDNSSHWWAICTTVAWLSTVGGQKQIWELQTQQDELAARLHSLISFLVGLVVSFLSIVFKLLSSTSKRGCSSSRVVVFGQLRTRALAATKLEQVKIWVAKNRVSDIYQPLLLDLCKCILSLLDYRQKPAGTGESSSVGVCFRLQTL